MFINFVACGAQMYKISLDGDTSVKSVNGVHTPPDPAIQDPASPRFGLNMPGGWVDLPVHLQLSAQLSESQRGAIARAMRTWEIAVGRPLFVYDGIDQRAGKAFRTLYSSLDDTVNGLYLKDNWDTLQKEEDDLNKKDKGVLATTIWNSWSRDTKKIDSADMHFNNQYYVLGDSLKENSLGSRIIVDMQTVALHELGHLLGLAHIKSAIDNASIMVFEVFIGEGLSARQLSEGDLDRVQKIYGCLGDACDHAKVFAAIDALNRSAIATKTPKNTAPEQDTAH